MMNLSLEKVVTGLSFTFPSDDGYVRNVSLALADKKLDIDGKRINSLRYLDGPDQNLVLLQQSET